MVFVGGPRQCGKTTLARAVLERFPYGAGRGGAYFNWDFDDDRRALLAREWPRSAEVIALDEIHKYPRWKSWLKGLHDTRGGRHRFLVTGSARLDVYRRGGDSLMGRYHYWRLHPLTLSEKARGIPQDEALRRLMAVGGFPEPFLDGDEREARRWRRERFDRVLRDDVRDLEPVQAIQTLSLFVDALRGRVGQLVVLSNIAADLEVSPNTLKRWLEVLERMYLVFVVRPHVRGVARAVRKPPKVYFFDNADVLDDPHHGEGARFENLVATHLLKRNHFLEDRDGHRYELRYLRDKEGREVDFVTLRDGKVVELVEAKYADRAVAGPLSYYAERLAPRRCRQIVARLDRAYSKGRLDVLDPIAALSTLDDPP
jgi:hypothetical protein